MPIVEALTIKAILSLKVLLLIAKTWLIHALALGIAFVLFTLKAMFIHTLLLFVVVGWLKLSGADSGWQVWLLLTVRLINPLSLLAFAGAFVWSIGLFLSGRRWVVSSSPQLLLTTALASPSFLHLPPVLEICMYVATLAVFWSVMNHGVSRIWKTSRFRQRVPYLKPRPS